MKKYLLTLFISTSLFSSAQNPLVKIWDKRFGGGLDDQFTSFQQTSDGGYILGGASYSGISGDKTQSLRGFNDYWIVKINAVGITQWDKTFGGSNYDIIRTVRQTFDGGYIIGGYSMSGITGDKTQDTVGGADYWIVKIDSLGNKQWDKDFGGTKDDILYALEPTRDGGYIFGGYSMSEIGGAKSQTLWGGTGDRDYWIVKTDSLGNKQWDKDFGGTDADQLYSLQITSDGGYIFGGYSASPISGNKTQVTWGSNDYWIIKTDSLGNIVWDRDFGGTDGDQLYSLKQTLDGGYILAGSSASTISGDKTQSVWGGWDYWIVKTDSFGNKQWDKNLGGIDLEELWSVFQTKDGGFLLAGDSYSPTSGDKTENNMAQEQSWIVKTDSLGNKEWDKTIFTQSHDENGNAIQANDGCYVLANFNNGLSGIGGYRTQTSQGAADYWIVKFCDSTVLHALFTTPAFLCPGTCTNFTNLSLNATSYQWNFFGASPDTSTAVNPQSICYANPGSYDVQLIATNANGSDTLLLTNYIAVYPTPPSQSITQIGDTLFAIAGAASYQWYYNTNIINGATNYFYVAPQSGDYNVVATDSNGCEVEAAVFNVVASVQSLNSSFPIVEPNPFSSHLTIHFPSSQNSPALLKIFNSIGEAVLEKEMKLEDQTLNLAALLQGIYLVSVLSEGKVYNQKIVK